MGFQQFRDGSNSRGKSSGTKVDDDAMESDEEDESNAKGDEVGDREDGKSAMLSAEDARKTGELAEGVKKIKVR